eukprot:365157-Chlamydomonas_euryale.AAC.39
MNAVITQAEIHRRMQVAASERQGSCGPATGCFKNYSIRTNLRADRWRQQGCCNERTAHASSANAGARTQVQRGLCKQRMPPPPPQVQARAHRCTQGFVHAPLACPKPSTHLQVAVVVDKEVDQQLRVRAHRANGAQYRRERG